MSAMPYSWSTGQTGVDVAAHKARHQDGGADEISVTGLSGLLADDQHVLDAEVTAVAVAKALYDAYTILMATANDTPIALTIAEQTLVGRITGGVIASLTGTQVMSIIAPKIVCNNDAVVCNNNEVAYN